MTIPKRADELFRLKAILKLAIEEIDADRPGRPVTCWTDISPGPTPRSPRSIPVARAVTSHPGQPHPSTGCQR